MKPIYAALAISVPMFLLPVAAIYAAGGKVELAKTSAEKLAEDPPPAAEIVVTDEALMPDAEAVNDSMTIVTQRLTECTENETPPQACQCKFQNELGALRTAYDSALAKHPAWKGKIVNLRKKDATDVLVSFPSVATQLENCK
jgi:hypothetical protein